MQPISRVFTRANVSTWTCSRCIIQSQTKRNARGYANGGGYTGQTAGRPRRRGRVVLAVATGGLGLGAIAFQDEAKHVYKAVQRTGRVAGTLALCINEYVDLLGGTKSRRGGRRE